MSFLKQVTEKTKYWKVTVTVLAAIVVFITTYALILPAITLDEDTAQAQGGIEMSADDNDTGDSSSVKASEDADSEDAVSGDPAENTGKSDKSEAKSEGQSSMEKEVLTSDGQQYKVTVSCGTDAGVPEGASLEVSEITPEDSDGDSSSEYDKYVSRTEEALGLEEGTLSYIRLFDIKIVDKSGDKVTIEAPVDVNIKLSDKDTSKKAANNTQVVHFADGAKKGDVIEDIDVSGTTVSFSAEGFSAYAIVEGPDGGIPSRWNKITSIDELTSQPIYIGNPDGFYFMNTITKTTDSIGVRYGITKTKPAESYPDRSKAAAYYFESAGSDNQFYAYCYAADGTTKQYVYNGGDRSLSFTTEDEKTVFTVTRNSNGYFVVNNGEWYWNQQGGKNGSRFCSYNTAGDANNNLVFWYYSEVTSDPYNLNGKSYGMLNWNGGAKGKAMLAEEGSSGSLKAKELTVMTKSNDETDHLFIPSDSGDISIWTFEWAGEDTYYLRSNSGGSLKIDNNGNLSIVDDADATPIQVVPGSGTRKGQICLKANGHTLTYSGSINSGFDTDGETGNEWLYLAEQSSNDENDYFMTHSARKVSISDDSVVDNPNIIIYTRAWNEEKKRYEFFAIDHDGTLVPVSEAGDSIEWVGGRVNTMLWQFTEYLDEATGEPNGYYELFNVYEEQFLAPQITDGQIMSEDTIGLNMNGRFNGKYYSTILAWDPDNYKFAGLKVENGQIVSCKKSEAMDFYFAIVEDIPVDDELHTVPTVDHTQYGITMKIQDFDSRAFMSDFLGDDTGGAVKNTVPRLLSNHLGEDGYPTTNTTEYPEATPGSLAQLMNNTKPVNHLFIESTYQESGYYEFDSTQNYASLKGQDHGDFTVYKEIASYDTGGNRPTLKHGQFFPYNDIQAGLFASVNGRNLYTATADPLPYDDPRRNEQLYLIKNADCFYGVELEASFIQTPNGEDAWGHDIIYEFTGDDDFWLYVNGELVIDLGGIHSALPGTINFKTGVVTQIDGEGNHVTSTLREIFESNYRARNPQASDTQVNNYLAEYFEGESSVFKTYSTNTMRIFYLERGGGAANLHMRFNLASVKPGTVELSKELDGVDDSETILAEFPYQVYYRVRSLITDGNNTGDEGEFKRLKDTGNKHPVLYKDTITAVPYKSSLTFDGMTYQDVYMLKPGETAEIDFTTVEDLEENQFIEYYIVECGVNTEVYDEVKVNGDTITGEAVSGHPNRKDYAIDPKSTGDRARVTYSNKVNENALRTLTFKKKLFKEDGVTPITSDEDDTEFEFRLYLGTEFDDQPALANMHTYHVKDPDGNYCIHVAGSGSSGGYFESLGKTDYDSLTDDEKEAASFSTSIYGTVSEIPVGYTVEVRELLAGTKFGVQERPWNIPDGYSFQKYMYTDDYPDTPATDCDYDQLPNLPDQNGAKAVTDVTTVNKDPHVDICNIRGWGMRINKKWSDQDYMSDRAPTYFAIFVRDSVGDLVLVGNDDVETSTVRQMAYNDDPSKQTLYWYFLHLPVSSVALQDYEIREVKLSEANPTVNSDGVVTNYGTVTPIDNGEEFELTGTQKGETSSGTFHYTALYEKGEVAEGSNVRVDKATNNRPGIVLRKTDWASEGHVGDPLAGATFELKTATDTIGTFTSDENGEITVAFLSDDVEYTLTETETPQGYHGMETPMTIVLDDGNVTVSGVDGKYYVLEQAAGETPVLTIKNRPYDLKVVKKERGSEDPLSGVTFELYQKKIVGGETRYDLMPGYDNLVTGDDGIVPLLDNTLPPGDYELNEKTPKEGYEPLPSRIRFSVSETGEIVLRTQPDGVKLNVSEKSDGTITYEVEILNSMPKKVSFMKVDIGSTGTGLPGAKFDLYKVENGTVVTPALYTGLVSGDDGILRKNSTSVFNLPSGTYQLVETTPPNGYNKKTDPVIITVTLDVDTEDKPFDVEQRMDGISYDEGTTLSSSGSGIKYVASSQTYTLKVSNSAGIELPSTGGPGTTLMYVLGGLLMLLAGAGLFIRRRRIM